MNKNDLPAFSSVDVISEKMSLYNLKCKDYLMLSCSAMKNEGISSALNWIIEAVTNEKAKKTIEDKL